MKTELWLPTKAAADALGISTDTLNANVRFAAVFSKPVTTGVRVLLRIAR